MRGARSTTLPPTRARHVDAGIVRVVSRGKLQGAGTGGDAHHAAGFVCARGAGIETRTAGERDIAIGIECDTSWWLLLASMRPANRDCAWSALSVTAWASMAAPGAIVEVAMTHAKYARATKAVAIQLRVQDR